MLLNIYHNQIAIVFIARVFLGILFFFQGYDAVFNIKISGVINTFQDPLKEKAIPRFLIVLAAYYTSFIELVGGFFLIVGFMKYNTLYLLGVDLLLVAFAFSMIRPMWDMQFVFPRLLLLIFLLLVPYEWDVFSVDHIWTLLKK